jgi:hypothetical protein
MACLLAAGYAPGAEVLDPPQPPLSNSAFFSVLEDFDHDGFPDLVGADRFAEQVIFLPGDGAGGFGPAWTAPVGDFPFAAAAADFDEDGELDLVVSNFYDLSVLLGNGEGTFQPEYRVPHGGELAKFPVTADLDGDGHVDIVVALRGVPYLVGVLLGHGDGTFEPVVDLPSVTRPRIPVVEDLNGDTILDLAVMAETSGELAVYLGNGDGTFQAGMFTDLPGGGATDMVAADLDGDGPIDLAVGDTFNEALQILHGNGDGTFDLLDRIPLGGFASIPGLGLGDPNGDGHDDLVAVRVNYGDQDHRVFFLAGSGNGNFVPEQSVPGDFHDAEHVLVGDVNGDAFPDAVVSLDGILLTSSAPQPGECMDGDGDGFGAPGDSGCPAGAATDCDDADGARSPGIAEVCDGVDNDCDGRIDEAASCPPVAVATAPSQVECTGPGGAVVLLDGSASTDGDPGPGDDIAEYGWYEDYGLPGQTTLGEGIGLHVSLSLGMHSLTLVVRDIYGGEGSASVVVDVQDTTGPTLTVTPSPAVLWPPNHRLVDVDVTLAATDLCDPSPPPIELVEVSSSEPDNAPGTGDGDTDGDVAGDDPGTADTRLQLRAERAADGPGRTYELRYEATDGFGNATAALGNVTVPHDQGGVVDPMELHVESGPAPGMAVLHWTDVAGAAGYDVIAGDLADVRLTGQVAKLGIVRVLAAGTTVTSATDGEGHEPGTFYLVQYQGEGGAAGYGTETAPWPRYPTSCTGGCP